MKVLILGSGVVGLSAARRLARQGAEVEVLEADEPGARGSRAAAGVAIPSVRLLEDPAMLAFTREARAALDEDLSALPDAGQLRRGEGILRITADERTRDALAERAGASSEWLGAWVDARRLVELEPVLEGGGAFGAFLSEAGHMVDTEAYLNALLRDLARLGGRVHFNQGARWVEEGGGGGVTVRTESATWRADQLVVCAGAWSGGIPGLRALPVRPLRGQMLTLRHPALSLRRVVSGPTYLAPWRAGDIVVGATEEEAGFAEQVTLTGILHLTAAVARLAPLLREARFERAWAGLRSATPHGQPLIGRYPGTRSVWLGTGHGGQGILTGALTGRLLCELLQTGQSEGAKPFEPTASLERIKS